MEYLSYIHFLVLGIVQGLTELLPISSSAHLIIANYFLNSNYSDTIFLTSLHLGTTLAIIIFYRADILKLYTNRNLFILLIISSIPAIIFGVFLNDIIDIYFRSIGIISLSLIVVGSIMIYTEKVYEKSRIGIQEKLEEITFKQALLIGFAQSLALIPGVSRSGITTLGGIYQGISKEVSLKYGFIIGIPILLGSFCYEYIKSEDSYMHIFRLDVLIGIVVAGMFAYISLYILNKLLIRNFLSIFGIYRVILGIILLTIFLLKYI